jgi:magnesium transporter
MSKALKKRSEKAGLQPGALFYLGDREARKADVSVIDYDEGSFTEQKVGAVEECIPFRDRSTVTWINVGGLDVDFIEDLGACFSLHPLLLEDIADTDQRPKLDEFEDYLFIVLRMLLFDEAQREVVGEQVSLVLGQNYVLSFQEDGGDTFDPVRERLRNNKGIIRKMGADHLAYSLFDAVVDGYFVILEKIGDRIEDLEDELVVNPTTEVLQAIYDLKRQMAALRKSVWPLREIISKLERIDTKLISESTKIYLRDVYDHTIQVIETVETYRDLLSGMLDIYLSSISNKMNEIMKVLTIIGTIFIPLTFVAGVYGMNFRNMPELNWAWGYPLAMMVMLAIALVMVLFFRRRRWL